MVAPSSEALFRPLTEAHVQMIKATILANTDSDFTMMVANITDYDPKDMDKDVQAEGARCIHIQCYRWKPD